MSKLFDELREMKAQYDRKLKADGQAALKEVFKDLFDKFPEIRSIVWAQYTPYFNDGDACEFSVHGFDCNLIASKSVKDKIDFLRKTQIDAAADGNYSNAERFKKEADKLEAQFNSDEDDYQYGNLYGLKNSKDAREREIGTAVADVTSELPSDVLESVFGNHVLIVATSQGFAISEYEHD